MGPGFESLKVHQWPIGQVVKKNWYTSKITLWILLGLLLGIGVGFTLSLTTIGAVREILGSGAIFGFSLGIADYMPLVFVLAPGAFFVLGYLMVLFNKYAKK